MNHDINDNKVLFSASTNGKRDIHDFDWFDYYADGMGLEIGCGNNRFSKTVLAIDRSVLSDADLIMDGTKLNFADRSFDFVFSSHCLKDFEDPETVTREWCRVIKPMGHLLLLLPNMEDMTNWEGLAGFKCTPKYILELSMKCPLKLIDMFEPENSTSFGMVFQRLPLDRDNCRCVFTQYGKAIVTKRTGTEVEVIYEDGSIRKLPVEAIDERSSSRFIGFLDILGGKCQK